ncbi:MAG: CDP-glycerol--glycerophosphate glycerophosphotransferase, partial [Clostridia bacterium]|nr:CDP-glycerol--glycerophosphate glycerophosphotransferase [Clostridia bacterium]
MTENFLYIDPGTGSMLFSILVGAAATIFFLGKAAFLKLKVFLSGKKDGSVVYKQDNNNN